MRERQRYLRCAASRRRRDRRLYRGGECLVIRRPLEYLNTTPGQNHNPVGVCTTLDKVGTKIACGHSITSARLFSPRSLFSLSPPLGSLRLLLFIFVNVARLLIGFYQPSVIALLFSSTFSLWPLSDCHERVKNSRNEDISWLKL